MKLKQYLVTIQTRTHQFGFNGSRLLSLLTGWMETDRHADRQVVNVLFVRLDAECLVTICAFYL